MSDTHPPAGAENPEDGENVTPPPPATPPPGYGQPGGPGQPATPPASGGLDPLDLGAMFSWAWKKFTENALTLIVGAIVIFLAVGIVAAVLATVLGLVFLSGAALTPAALTDSGTGALSLLLFNLVLTFAVAVVAYLLGSGYVKALLAITQGRTPTLGEALTPHDPGRIVPFAVIVAAIYAVVQALGALVPIFGGMLASGASLVIGVALWFALPLVVDRNLEPVEALKSSVDLVSANLLAVIVLYIVVGFTAVIGAIACLVGLLVTGPVAALLYVNGYKRFTGQPIAG